MTGETLRLIRFRDLTVPQLSEVTEIYRAEFDSPWEWPVTRLTALARPDARDAWWARAAVRDDRAVGFAVAQYLPGTGLWYLLYLAVEREARGAGLGSWVLQQVTRAGEYAAREHGRPGCSATLVEVETVDGPPAGADVVARKRRIAFYRRHGAVPVEARTPRSPDAPPEMPEWDLWLIPGRDWQDSAEQRTRRKIVTSMMVHGYGTSPGAPWLLKALDSLS